MSLNNPSLLGWGPAMIVGLCLCGTGPPQSRSGFPPFSVICVPTQPRPPRKVRLPCRARLRTSDHLRRTERIDAPGVAHRGGDYPPPLFPRPPSPEPRQPPSPSQLKGPDGLGRRSTAHRSRGCSPASPRRICACEAGGPGVGCAATSGAPTPAPASRDVR